MSWIDERTNTSAISRTSPGAGKLPWARRTADSSLATDQMNTSSPGASYLGWQIRCDCPNEWRDGPLWLAPAGMQGPDEVQTAWAGRSVTVEEAGRNYWRMHHRA